MRPSVLLVEDDQALSFEIAAYLTHVGFDVRQAATILAAEEALARPFDLCILDINLPDGSGLDLCRHLRQHSLSGLIIASARDDRDLRIAGLKECADAFLVKPISLDELEATLLSVYRRLETRPPGALLSQSRPLPWRLDLAQSFLIAPQGVAILLSSNERTILHALFASPNLSVMRSALISLIETQPDDGSEHRLEALISRLRRKVQEKSGMKLPMLAEYGRGYRFSAQARISGAPH